MMAEELDADVILLNGELTSAEANVLIRNCRTREKRSNVVLILVTYGGDPDAAFQIARYLQREYEHFSLFVSGVCKSAGTLIATGAHELIISDLGELGPIDIQVPKRGESLEWQSGLAVSSTLAELHEWASSNFIDFALEIVKDDELRSTLPMAMDSAAKVTTGLLSELYKQIDPLQIGEVARAMDIMSSYGGRLLELGKNIEPDALDDMITAYPTHSFVIDRAEAESLFHNVRSPTDIEYELLAALEDHSTTPVAPDEPVKLEFLCPELGHPELAPQMEESYAHSTTREEVCELTKTD